METGRFGAHVGRMLIIAPVCWLVSSHHMTLTAQVFPLGTPGRIGHAMLITSLRRLAGLPSLTPDSDNRPSHYQRKPSQLTAATLLKAQRLGKQSSEHTTHHSYDAARRLYTGFFEGRHREGAVRYRLCYRVVQATSGWTGMVWCLRRSSARDRACLPR